MLQTTALLPLPLGKRSLPVFNSSPRVARRTARTEEQTTPIPSIAQCAAAQPRTEVRWQRPKFARATLGRCVRCVLIGAWSRPLVRGRRDSLQGLLGKLPGAVRVAARLRDLGQALATDHLHQPDPVPALDR